MDRIIVMRAIRDLVECHKLLSEIGAMEYWSDRGDDHALDKVIGWGADAIDELRAEGLYDDA